MDRTNLIFNRTQADIDMVLALIRNNVPLPPDNLKIAWDWRALNRIESFTAYLADILNLYGYKVSIETKTNWTTEDVSSEEEGNRVLSNIRLLRNAYGTASFEPPVPSVPSFLTFTLANNIEQILYDMDVFVEHMITAWFMSGEVMSGEV